MTATISSNIFQADWPKRCDPAQKPFLQKVTKIFWDIISIVIFPIGIFRLVQYYLRNLAFRIAIPGQVELDTMIWNYFDLAKVVVRFLFNPENFKANLTREGKWSLKNFQGESVRLKAPDGATLDGAFFPGRYRKKAILFVGGNAEQWEVHPWIGPLKQFDASLFTLNVRGVGKSYGKRYEDGYAMDIYTAAEWLIQKQGIDPEDIVFAGFSMGAAQTTRGAALIQEKYPDKKISAININSFADLHTEIQHVLKSGILMRLAKWIENTLSIDMNVKRDWDILKGNKYLFHASKDPIILKPAQLATAVLKNPVGKTHLIEFTDQQSHIPCNNATDRRAFEDAILDLLKLDRRQTKLSPLSWSEWARPNATITPRIIARAV